jgi:hypothetical protein
LLQAASRDFLAVNGYQVTGPWAAGDGGRWEAPAGESLKKVIGGGAHDCPGTWQYVGVNGGHHQVFRCDTGDHWMIAAHTRPARVP